MHVEVTLTEETLAQESDVPCEVNFSPFVSTKTAIFGFAVAVLDRSSLS
jgi:hypothetical protein